MKNRGVLIIILMLTSFSTYAQSIEESGWFLSLGSEYSDARSVTARQDSSLIGTVNVGVIGRQYYSLFLGHQSTIDQRDYNSGFTGFNGQLYYDFRHIDWLKNLKISATYQKLFNDVRLEDLGSIDKTIQYSISYIFEDYIEVMYNREEFDNVNIPDIESLGVQLVFRFDSCLYC